MFLEGISAGRFRSKLEELLEVTITSVIGAGGSRKLIFDYKGYQHVIELESIEEELGNGEFVDSTRVTKITGTFEDEVFEVIDSL